MNKVEIEVYQVYCRNSEDAKEVILADNLGKHSAEYGAKRWRRLGANANTRLKTTILL